MGELAPGTSVVVTIDGREHPGIVQDGPQGVTMWDMVDRRYLDINAAGIAAGDYEVRVETNFERLRREAEITDPSDPLFNSDLDIIYPGSRLSGRDIIRAGIDPNDEEATLDYVNRTGEAPRTSRA